MLNAIDFACLCERWQKKCGVSIDADIIGKIYRENYQISYDNYSLMELIYQLYLARVQILCPWNKKAIIDMIKEYDIEIPEKTANIIIWEYDIRPDILYIYNYDFTFTSGDKIQLSDGQIYTIIMITVDNICLENTNNNDNKHIRCEEFIQLLYNNPDITILQNMDKYYFMPI